jgi:membrane associated rhomboid family serine protease
LLLLPWEVDVPEERRPWMNWAVIGLCVGFFALEIYVFVNYATEADLKEGIGPVDWMAPYALKGWTLRGMLGHMWLHGGYLHLLGNMYFLWIFGNAVCAKVGNLLYLPIYLAAGLAAAIAHVSYQGGAAIGASGAINGIVGMFLVFFPQNEMTCYFVWISAFYPIVREIELSSVWMIVFWVFWDVVGAMMGGSPVAYFAHLGGFAAGVAIALILLQTKVIKMEKYERSLIDVFKGRKLPEEDLAPSHGGYGIYARLAEQAEQEARLRQGYAAASKAGEALASAARNDSEEKVLSGGPDGLVVKAVTSESMEGTDGFIRFACSCGKRLKMPGKYAGRMGHCPQCGERLKIPQK